MTATLRPEIRGRFGVVASTHWIGSAVGFAALERGGNAFDAAVAAGFALQIVEPHLNGPGGEVPILGLPAGAAAPFVLCGQGVAPAAATPERFAALGLDLIPGTGHLPAVVPGAFDAWMLLLRDHGRLEPRDVLAPAVDLAERGFPLVHRAAASIHAIAAHFRAHWPESARVWLPGGAAPASGALVRTPGIAETYRRILAEAEAARGGREARIEAARRAWREGFVAEAVDRFLRAPLTDAAGRSDAGLLTGEDMARWEARYEAPISARFDETEVFKAGPWSQGAALLQVLGMLAADPMGEMDPLGPDRVHLIAEAMKLALADRDAWLADPGFSEVPLGDLLDPGYLAARRAAIGPAASDRKSVV